MQNVVLDEVRRTVLGLLFVVAFGWMASQVMPGQADQGPAWQQVATGEARY